MYTLKNWKVEAHHGKMIVWGEVYGHEKYQDGLSLHTSMIQAVDMDDRHVLFSTKNSVYSCAFSAHAVNVKDVQAFDQLPDELFACDRKMVKKKILDAVSAGLNAVADRLQSFMQDVSGDYTLILFDTDADYYFRWMLQIRDGKKYLVPQNGVAIREGSVQDSVLIGNGVKGQVLKYFPFADNRLTFYEWEDSWEPVFFLNAGKKDIRLECSYGSFALKAGERLCPSRESEKNLEPVIEKEAETVEEVTSSAASPKDEAQADAKKPISSQQTGDSQGKSSVSAEEQTGDSQGKSSVSAEEQTGDSQ
ncbi:MAG: hypothetical protein ACOYBF_07235, partial [Bilifractor porci]